MYVLFLLHFANCTSLLSYYSHLLIHLFCFYTHVGCCRWRCITWGGGDEESIHIFLYYKLNTFVLRCSMEGDGAGDGGGGGKASIGEVMVLTVLFVCLMVLIALLLWCWWW